MGALALLAQLATIARAVWTSDHVLANRAFNTMLLGPVHLVRDSKPPKLVDPIFFEKEFSFAKKSHLEREKSALILSLSNSNNKSNQHEKQKLKNKMEIVERKAELFRGRAPYLSLHALLIGPEQAASLNMSCGAHFDHESIHKILVHTWAPIFTNKIGKSSMANSILKTYRSKVHYNWSLAPPPTREMSRKCVEKSKDSAGGTDGTVNACWRNGGEEAVDSLAALVEQQCLGIPPHPEYSEGMWIFPPKKHLPTDPLNLKVQRNPLDLRPLCLNNTDNKHVGSVAARCVMPVLQDCISSSQRGFVPGRQMLANVVELDLANRIQAFRCYGERKCQSFDQLIPTHSIASLAACMLFDYSTAFASVSHDWIFSVLKSCRAPEGFCNIVRNRYRGCRAYLLQEGCTKFLFQVKCGVLQGCPLSSVLFLMCIDPLLFLFSSSVCIAPFGHVFACADDIAITVRHLGELVKVFQIFKIYSEVTGLVVKPSKCVLILLSVFASPINVSRIRVWLSAHIPEWQTFKVSNFGLYLGFQVGPLAGAKQWEQARIKFSSRVGSIQLQHEPAQLAIRSYASRAVSVFGYLAQLALVPPSFSRLERNSLARVLHLATNSCSLGVLNNMEALVGLKVPSLSSFLLACRVRTALTTINNVEVMHQQLVNYSNMYSNLRAIALSDFSPPGWDQPAFITNLFRALSGSAYPAPAANAVSAAISSWLQHPSKSLQGVVFRALSRHLPSDWPALFARRVQVLCPQFSGNLELARSLFETRMLSLPPPEGSSCVQNRC